MSRETVSHLNTNTLFGNTDARGFAWHYRAKEQGEQSNRYPGPIPIEDVRDWLFSWTALSRPLAVEVPCDLLAGPTSPLTLRQHDWRRSCCIVRSSPATTVVCWSRPHVKRCARRDAAGHTQRPERQRGGRPPGRPPPRPTSIRQPTLDQPTRTNAKHLLEGT